MWLIDMFYFESGMDRLKSTVNGSTFLLIFKCLMGNGNRKLGVILSTVFLDFHDVGPQMADSVRRHFLAGFMVFELLSDCHFSRTDPFSGHRQDDFYRFLAGVSL